MKRMTVLISILLIAALCVPMSARADVIYEPFDDFYEQHREECTYVGRSYTSSGPNGTVTLYASPADPGVEKEYPNGTALYVSYTYQAADGILWGCCDKWEDDATGWAPMEYLELIYDEQSFCEEYGDQFVEETGSIGADYLGQTILFWSYPGSDSYIEVTLPSGSDGYLPEYQTTYTDASGTKWGKCMYYRGIKSHWISLYDPTAPGTELILPVATAPAETEFIGAETVDEIKPSGTGLKLTVIIAVSAVVIVTAALLLVLKRKEK